MKSNDATVVMKDAEAIEIFQYFKKNAAKKSKALDFEPGRGGRIQNRLIIELPHELEPKQRVELVKEFCEKSFKDLKTPKGPKSVPYWAVIHAPDIHNDPRNSHVHIVFSERPTEKITVDGKTMWDFEYKIRERDNAKHYRERKPYVQERVRQFQNRAWPKKARDLFAKIATEHLKNAGQKKILDPRSYKDMGLEVEKRSRISAKEYLDEKKGVETVGGEKALKVQWDRLIADLEQRTAPKINKPMDLKFQYEIRRWKSSVPSISEALVDVHNVWRSSIKMMAGWDADAAAVGIVVEKVRSRLDPPLKTKRRIDPRIERFLKLFITAQAATGRRFRAAKERTKAACERYLTEVSQAQTPTEARTTSKFVLNDIKIKSPDKLALINRFIGIINKTVEVAKYGDLQKLHEEIVAITKDAVEKKRSEQTQRPIETRVRQAMKEQMSALDTIIAETRQTLERMREAKKPTTNSYEDEINRAEFKIDTARQNEPIFARTVPQTHSPETTNISKERPREPILSGEPRTNPSAQQGAAKTVTTTTGINQQKPEVTTGDVNAARTSAFPSAPGQTTHGIERRVDRPSDDARSLFDLAQELAIDGKAGAKAERRGDPTANERTKNNNTEQFGRTAESQDGLRATLPAEAQPVTESDKKDYNKTAGQNSEPAPEKAPKKKRRKLTREEQQRRQRILGNKGKGR